MSEELHRALRAVREGSMTVYVDDARLHYRGMRMSHMQADTLDELHAMADAIGLRREWFQPGSRPEAAHYDVSDTKRQEVIALGAVPETTRQGAERRRAVRGGKP